MMELDQPSISGIAILWPAFLSLIGVVILHFILTRRNEIWLTIVNATRQFIATFGFQQDTIEQRDIERLESDGKQIYDRLFPEQTNNTAGDVDHQSVTESSQNTPQESELPSSSGPQQQDTGSMFPDMVESVWRFEPDGPFPNAYIEFYTDTSCSITTMTDLDVDIQGTWKLKEDGQVLKIWVNNNSLLGRWSWLLHWKPTFKLAYNDKEETAVQINSNLSSATTIMRRDWLAELKRDGKDIRENYLPPFEPLPKQQPEQPSKYYPTMIPPTPLSKFIDNIDWKSVNPLKRSRTNSGIHNYCQEIDLGKKGYEAEVKIFRALERLKLNEELIVLHSLEYTHSDYQYFVGNHVYISGEREGTPIPCAREPDQKEGECDFVIMGRNYFVIIEVKQNRAHSDNAKLQAGRTEKLIAGTAARISCNTSPQIFKFAAFPYEKRKDMENITKSDLENDESFSNWWKTKVTDKLSVNQQSPPLYEEIKNVLIALWANKNDKREKKRCSLGWNVRDIDEKLRTAVITLERKGERNPNSNPGVIEAPPVIWDNVGVRYLTKEQDKVFKSEEQLLWINGPAGSGKTVIMCGKILQLALSDKENKVVVFTFAGKGNNANVYQSALVKAGVTYGTVTVDDIRENTELVNITASKQSNQVVIVKIEPWYDILTQFTELLESQQDSSIFIDDVHVVMDNSYTDYTDYTDDSEMTRQITLFIIIDTLIGLSSRHYVCAVCDPVQYYCYYGTNHQYIIPLLDTVLEMKLSSEQRVVLSKNLRNTCDLSNLLSEIRDVFIGIVGSELGKLLPKQVSGHFIRGPITRIHVMNYRDDNLLRTVLVREFKVLSNELNISDIGIVYNVSSNIKRLAVGTLSREGYNTASIPICYCVDSASSEWPAVIVLHEVWPSKEVNLAELYISISRARVRCTVLLYPDVYPDEGYTLRDIRHMPVLLDKLEPFAQVIRH